MSQASELLDSLVSTASVDPELEGHIVIGDDRFITVPKELKRIAVQHDHNMETVTFDCPRYWDGIDMSKMVIYINYTRADGVVGSYIADNVVIDSIDDSIMHFDWTLMRFVTEVVGDLSFLVCIKKTDANGNEVNHWNSELCKAMYISEGLECDGSTIEEKYPDVITQLVLNMQSYVNTYFKENPLEVIQTFEQICTFATKGDIDDMISGTYVDEVNDSGSDIIDEEYMTSNDDIDKIINGSYVDNGD